MRSTHFTEIEFNTEIYRTFGYGDLQGIAHRTGKSYSVIQKSLNPEEEKESALYLAASILAAGIEENEERGKERLSVFLEFVERAIEGKDTETGRVLNTINQVRFGLAKIENHLVKHER